MYENDVGNSKQQKSSKKETYNKKPWKPTLRDNRSYKEVIQEVINEDREKQRDIAFSATIRLEENHEMVKNLKNAIVTETNGVISNDVVYERAFKVWPPIVIIFNMVPSKYVIILKSVEEVEEVLKENCPLSEMFHDMRKWNQLEDISQRMVCIECVGILPHLGIIRM